MKKLQPLTREQQIALMEGAKERLSENAAKWTTQSDIKADLHRYDRGHHNMRSYAVGD